MSALPIEVVVNSYEIDHTLREVERAIELSSGPGFQQTVHRAIPPFSAREAKEKLDQVQATPAANDAQRARVFELRERLRSKFSI